MIQKFYSNGKLLLTGEYVILDGAIGLALPTIYGQFLTVIPIESPCLIWESLDEAGNVWFELNLSLKSLNLPNEEIIFNFSTPEKLKIAKTLIEILQSAKRLNPEFLLSHDGYKVTTKLTFPKDWGLGSSSTLLNNIAQWAGVDAYQLLWTTLGGSGYDIACAKYNEPILYSLTQKEPTIEKIAFEPSFKDQLYFVYLNKKQNSQAGILNYKTLRFDKATVIQHISAITKSMISCENSTQFTDLVQAHELLLATILGIKPVKELLFPDYVGGIKSLGAWGGDFILAVGDQTTPNYFKDKNYKTVFPYSDLIL